jgi:hypothetical protein
MKKALLIISGLAGLVFLFFLAISAIEHNNKSAFSTSPEEVLYHSDEITVGIKKIYKTIYVDSEKVSYVFLQGDNSVPTLYLLKFKRESYGWEYIKMNEIPISIGAKVDIKPGKNTEYYGISSSDVDVVTLGTKKAKLISLEEEKLWFFYKPTNKELKRGLKFYNREGKEL